MSYEKLKGSKDTQNNSTMMHYIMTMERRDITSFFREHKGTAFDCPESEELVNKLIKRKKWSYIFSHLDQFKFSDYDKMMNKIIDNGGGNYIKIYLGKIDELGIKLDERIRDRLEELGFLKASSRHKNVFVSKTQKPSNKSYIIPPSDPRNFRG